jgi:hypothetical protein
MFDYINRYYGLSLKRGMTCEFMGRGGKVTGVCGAYVLIKLDGDKKSGKYHPTWMIEYGDVSD